MVRHGSWLVAGLLLLATSAPAQVCTKVCCATHAAVAGGFLDQLVSLQQQVKQESVAKFTGNFDRQKAKSFLTLTAGALREMATHYETLQDAADKDAATALAARLQTASQEISSAPTDAAAKGKFEALNLDLKLPKPVATASAEGH